MDNAMTCGGMSLNKFYFAGLRTCAGLANAGLRIEVVESEE